MSDLIRLKQSAAQAAVPASPEYGEAAVDFDCVYMFTTNGSLTV